MAPLTRMLVEAATYRRLAYLISGVPLGLVWFVSLVTLWSLCLGLVITPFVIPLVVALALITRGFASVEAQIARSLLAVEARAPSPPSAGRGFWAWLRGLFGASFWRAQAYLLIGWFVGFPVGIAVFTLIVGALGMIFAPLWVPFVHGGAHLGFWRPHTVWQSLALVPAGAVLLPVGLLIATPVAAVFRPVASSLLGGDASTASGPGMAHAPALRARGERRIPPRRALEIHGGLTAVVIAPWSCSGR